MNAVESAAVAMLLDWLLNPHAIGERAEKDALSAAVVLAEAADAETCAWTGDEVRAAWPNMLEGCSGCPVCEPEPVGRPVETVTTVGGAL